MPRALIAVFDGLMPTQVTPETMPHVHALAKGGVTFARHHAVFPTVTRANAASMVTGASTGCHGIAANRVVIDEYDPGNAMEVLEPELSALAQHTDGQVLLTSTIGERLAAKGMSWVSLVGGTSGNAYVQHPRATEVGGAVIHREFALPRHLFQEVIERFGPWPPKVAPAIEVCERMIDVAVEFVLPELDPDVLLVWFPEPDTSHHAGPLGSKMALEAVQAADAQFGRLLGGLSERREDPDVFVLSDHGYSMIAKVVDVEAEVRAAGFPRGGEPGGVVVCPNGGSASFYLPDRDDGAFQRLARWLAERPWVGGMVSGWPGGEQAGLLPASTAGLAGPRAPDIAVSMHWEGPTTQPRWVYSASGKPGVGNHGSGSPLEMRNTLIAAGPSLKRGIVSHVPSGNIDLAATLLHLLGIAVPDHMEGRVLREAVAGGPAPEEVGWVQDRAYAKIVHGRGSLSHCIAVERVAHANYVSSLGRD